MMHECASAIILIRLHHFPYGLGGKDNDQDLIRIMKGKWIQ